MEGKKLSFTPEALDEVAKKAIERKTGARGLRSILETMLLDTMFELPGLTDVDEVVVTADTVKKGTPPTYVTAAAGSKDKPKKEKPVKDTTTAS